MLNRKAFLIPFLMLIVSCQGPQENQAKASEKKEVQQDSLTSLPIQENEVRETTPASKEDSLSNPCIFQNFALNYNPWKLELPHAPDSVLQSMRVLKEIHPEAYEQSLCLIFLKLAKLRLQCCRDNYENQRVLGRAEPLIEAFEELSSEHLVSRELEFIPSLSAFHYVHDHPHLLNYPALRREYNVVVQLRLLEN